MAAKKPTPKPKQSTKNMSPKAQAKGVPTGILKNDASIPPPSQKSSATKRR